MIFISATATKGMIKYAQIRVDGHFVYGTNWPPDAERFYQDVKRRNPNRHVVNLKGPAPTKQDIEKFMNSNDPTPIFACGSDLWD